jgi:hypothetical protein
MDGHGYQDWKDQDIESLHCGKLQLIIDGNSLLTFRAQGRLGLVKELIFREYWGRNLGIVKAVLGKAARSAHVKTHLQMQNSPALIRLRRRFAGTSPISAWQGKLKEGGNGRQLNAKVYEKAVSFQPLAFSIQRPAAW